MINNIDLAINSYNKAKGRFLIEHDTYIKLCNDKSAIVLSENAEAFAALREVITWIVFLYDRIKKAQVTDDDKFFMSGIKYIDNVLKHEKSVFELYSVQRPGFTITVDAVDGESGPEIKSVEWEPCLVWGELEKIPVKAEYIKQRENYFKFVKEEGVLKSINKMDAIINKYYVNNCERNL